MKPYLISLAVGLLVGAIYALLNVRSPAPPTIALLGLLGMLLGEAAIPVVKRVFTGQAVAAPVQSSQAEPVSSSAAKREDQP